MNYDTGSKRIDTGVPGTCQCLRNNIKNRSTWTGLEQIVYPKLGLPL